MRRLFSLSTFLLSVALLMLVLGLASPQAMPLSQSLEVSDLAIEASSGTHNFKVEVARTPRERNMGLMFRSEMSDSSGMLFLFPYPQKISMWMKNTYISLDMVFILPDGTISMIIENAEPLSLRTLDSRGPSIAVLELVAGTVKKLSIREGDLVKHESFSNKF